MRLFFGETERLRLKFSRHLLRSVEGALGRATEDIWLIVSVKMGDWKWL